VQTGPHFAYNVIWDVGVIVWPGEYEVPLPSAAVVHPANGRPGLIMLPTVAKSTVDPTVA
jgi:hypothetical protein